MYTFIGYKLYGVGSSSTKGLTVTNCEVGLIGGTLHNYDNGKAVRDGKNLLIKDNILRRAGYGWGNQRPDKNESAHIKSWNMRNEYTKGTYIIENNVFDRSSWRLTQTLATYDAWCPIYRNNTYVQYIDGGLSQYKAFDLTFD